MFVVLFSLSAVPLYGFTGEDAGYQRDNMTERVTVSGICFHDVNRTRIMETEEEGIPNVRILLKRFATPELFSISCTKTDADGLYEFTITREGLYLLEEQDPQDVFTSTTPNAQYFYVVFPHSGKKTYVDFGDLKFKGHGEVPLYTYPGDDMSLQCAEGTVERVQKKYYDEDCTNLAIEYGLGGYPGICIACGDGTCDSEYESVCNCPEDCAEDE